MKKTIKILAELTKIKITAFVTVTTAFGYIAATGAINAGIILPTFGILLLACGSAALNHWQESGTDAKMDRTRNRPIPSGKITAENALYVSVSLVITGSLVLFFSSGLLALGFGLLNLVWYNIIYTLLKRVSPLAIIPGSLVGAIPPVIGWIAGGGNLLDPQIIIIAFFFFIWQIPHFWLLLLVLDKDYKQAGFPTLTEIFDHKQLARITFIWILATVVTGFLIPLFQLIHYPVINLSLLIAGVLLSINAFNLISKTNSGNNFMFAFRNINYFALYVVFAVSLDKLIF